jgi:hypothetical protein
MSDCCDNLTLKLYQEKIILQREEPGNPEQEQPDR